MRMHNTVLATVRAVILIGTLVFAASASAQVEDLKVGVVSVNQLLEQAPQFRAAMQALQEEFAPRQRELVALQRSLQEKQETYERDGAIMAEAERLNLEREIRDVQRDFAREQGDMNEDANIRQNEELSSLQRSLLQEVQNFARTEGYDLVVADALYFSSAIDITDDVLEALDLVVVSVHSLMDMDRVSMTDRVITAIQHPQVDILAHPTGRLLARREPFQIEMEEVLQAARDLNVAVEINASPHRLDLNDVHAHRAKELGVRVCISTDAHSVQRLDQMSYGVDQARRAWLTKGDVLNTMTLKQMRGWLHRREGTSA